MTNFCVSIRELFYKLFSSFWFELSVESGFFSEEKERQRTTNELLLFIENDNSFV